MIVPLRMVKSLGSACGADEPLETHPKELLQGQIISKYLEIGVGSDASDAMGAARAWEEVFLGPKPQLRARLKAYYEDFVVRELSAEGPVQLRSRAVLEQWRQAVGSGQVARLTLRKAPGHKGVRWAVPGEPGRARRAGHAGGAAEDRPWGF